ncbi:MAG: hypothetical protein ABI852_01095 [Gemmatimonadaceae bacterium]
MMRTKSIYDRLVAGVLMAMIAIQPACFAADISQPTFALNPVKIEKVELRVPSHELRFLVDSNGNLKGLETVRTRSTRPGFIAKTRGASGHELSAAPEKLRAFADSMQHLAKGIPIIFIQQDRNVVNVQPHESALGEYEQIPFRLAADIDSSALTGSSEEREAYYDAVVDQISYSASSYLDETDPDDFTPQYLRAGAIARPDVIQSQAAPPSAEEMVGLGIANAPRIETDCGDKREDLVNSRWGLIGAAVIGIAGVVAVGPAAAIGAIYAAGVIAFTEVTIAGMWSNTYNKRYKKCIGVPGYY